MPWARFDDDYDEQPAVLGLSHAAYRLNSGLVIYCCNHETGGSLTLAQIHAKARQINVHPAKTLDEIVKAGGLLEEVEGGYTIPDFLARHGKPLPKDKSGAKRAADLRERDRQAELALYQKALRNGQNAPLRNGYVTGVHARVPDLTCPDLYRSSTTTTVEASPDLVGGGGFSDSDPDSEPSFAHSPVDAAPVPNPPNRPLSALSRPDREALHPSVLMLQFTEQYPEEVPRLAEAVASAKRAVSSQAKYLRPLILRILGGDEPRTLGSADVRGAPAKVRGTNYETDEWASAIRNHLYDVPRDRFVNLEERARNRLRERGRGNPLVESVAEYMRLAYGFDTE